VPNLRRVLVRKTITSLPGIRDEGSSDVYLFQNKSSQIENFYLS
jgi:hypothetical protein